LELLITRGCWWSYIVKSEDNFIRSLSEKSVKMRLAELVFGTERIELAAMQVAVSALPSFVRGDKQRHRVTFKMYG
jgi:hypothetical protein